MCQIESITKFFSPNFWLRSLCMYLPQIENERERQVGGEMCRTMHKNLFKRTHLSLIFVFVSVECGIATKNNKTVELTFNVCGRSRSCWRSRHSGSDGHYTGEGRPLRVGRVEGGDRPVGGDPVRGTVVQQCSFVLRESWGVGIRSNEKKYVRKDAPFLRIAGHIARTHLSSAARSCLVTASRPRPLSCSTPSLQLKWGSHGGHKRVWPPPD